MRLLMDIMALFIFCGFVLGYEDGRSDKMENCRQSPKR